jgi:hypothetical protein
MKQIIFFLLFLPCLALSQDIVSDTAYIQKQGEKYYIVTQTLFEDNTITGNKEFLGDSTAALAALVSLAERPNNLVALYAKGVIQRASQNRRTAYYNDLHQQISGRPVFNTTAARDTAAMVGTWRLNDTPGRIVYTATGRLQFRPDPAPAGRTYTITTNLVLRTFANYVGFTVGGEALDLYRVNEKRFSDIAGNWVLRKIE